jgi:hypothetical protein
LEDSKNEERKTSESDDGIESEDVQKDDASEIVKEEPNDGQIEAEDEDADPEQQTQSSESSKESETRDGFRTRPYFVSGT